MPMILVVHHIVLLLWVEINVKVISMGHTEFLVKVELTWVQDLGSFFKFSRRFLTSMLGINYKIKVAQKIYLPR